MISSTRDANSASSACCTSGFPWRNASSLKLPCRVAPTRREENGGNIGASWPDRFAPDKGLRDVALQMSRDARTAQKFERALAQSSI